MQEYKPREINVCVDCFDLLAEKIASLQDPDCEQCHRAKCEAALDLVENLLNHSRVKHFIGGAE